jgi:hypothetical protein
MATLIYNATNDPMAQRAAMPQQNRQNRQNRRNRQGFQNPQDGTADIDALFRGIQQTRGIVRRDMAGNIMTGDQPTGLNKLYADNPQLRGASQRQAQYDQQARGNAAAAVAERKAMQEIQANTPNPNLVTGADGYRTIFNSKGQAVGTTAPVGTGAKRVYDDALGRMVPMDQWFKERRKDQASKGMIPTAMQQAAQASMASRPSGMDQIFTGTTSPSGGQSENVVGFQMPQGAPGGELFGQMPEFKSGGMTMPQQKVQPVLPNDLGSVFAQQSRQKYFNPAQLSGSLQTTPEQAQVKRDLTPEQAQVKRDLNVMSNMQFRMADFYPGSDYAQLEQMFPGFKFNDYATTNQALDALRQLLSMY